MALTDQARQAHGAAVDQGNAPAPAVDAEHRVLLGHPQIAPDRQLQAAGDRVTGDGRDHRLRQRQPRRLHRSVTVDAVTLDALAGGYRLQVGAGAKCAARAPQHRDLLLGVGLEGAEGVGQLFGRLVVDGVAGLGPVQNDGRDGTLALDEDLGFSGRGCGGLGHGRGLSFWALISNYDSIL